jgi:hypothetical protein
LDILYTTANLPGSPLLKQIIRRVNPNASMVVTETLKVIEQRIGNQPHRENGI